MADYSIALYERLEEETGVKTGETSLELYDAENTDGIQS